MGSAQQGDGSKLDRPAPLPTCCAGPRPVGPPLALGIGQARVCPEAAATTTTPQCGHRAYRARRPQVPTAEPGPERAAPTKVTQPPGQAVLRSYRGVRGTGGARAQVAVELVLFGARLHGAAARAAQHTPERARASATGYDCAPAPGPPRPARTRPPRAAAPGLRLHPGRARA